jgi:septum formation protein
MGDGETVPPGTEAAQATTCDASAGDFTPPQHEHSFVEVTSVDFCELSASAIERYIASGEPMDKAGSYGIQGLGGTFVTGIRGCYHNVVGFPMHRFCKEIDLERLR